MRKLVFYVLPVVLALPLTGVETYSSDTVWVRLLGTTTWDTGFDVAVDSNGNSYVTGKTWGNLDGHTNMGSYDIFAARYDANGIKQWVNLLGTLWGDAGNGIAVDSNGDSYITGETLKDLDGQSNAGGMDIFITKYNSDGNKIWTKLLGTSTWERGLGIALDSNGNSYVTGEVSGDLDGQSFAGFVDLFVAKHDADGNKIWTRLLGTSAWDTGFDIAVDSNGNSYITGFTFGNLDGIMNEGSKDIFVAKYDTGGNKIWTELLGTSGEDVGRGIAVDSNGNSYITGFTSGNLDGNMNAGSKDIFIAKYDAGGNNIWTRLFGTPSKDIGRGIAVDSGGNSYITGYTSGNLGGNASAGSEDVFVAKYDTGGNQKWTKSLGTSSEDIGCSIAIDSGGNSYVTGSTQGDPNGENNAGEQDILIWKTVDRSGGAMPWVPLLLFAD